MDNYWLTSSFNSTLPLFFVCFSTQLFFLFPPLWPSFFLRTFALSTKSSKCWLESIFYALLHNGIWWGNWWPATFFVAMSSTFFSYYSIIFSIKANASSLSTAWEANHTNLGHNLLYRRVTLKLTSSSTFVLLLSKIHPLFASLVHLFKMYISGIVFMARKSKTFRTWQHKIPTISNFLQIHENVLSIVS